MEWGKEPYMWISSDTYVYITSNSLASWCEEPTHWKRPWCLERPQAGREGDDRGWNGWITPKTQWIWVWVNQGDGKGKGRLSSVQSWSRVQLFVTPWTGEHQASLFITNSHSLLKLISIESYPVMPSNHLILCCPPLLPPSIFLSIRVFSNESVPHFRWPKYWSFSFSISPSSEYSGLLSFKMDWLYLLAVQATLRSLLQHHSSKASILWCLAFFKV